MSTRPQVVEHESRRRPVAGGVLATATAGLIGWALWTLPRGTNPLPALARQAMTIALPDWHTLEPVNEIVYGTRGFDTFGETFLLLAAVMGIGVVARSREPRSGYIGEQAAGQREQRTIDPYADATTHEGKQAESADRAERGRGGRQPTTPDNELLGTSGPELARAMTVPVRGAVRFLVPVLLICGLYLAAWGYSPGGGFPAGAVVLGAVLLAYAALGYRRVQPLVRPSVVEPIEIAGALLIAALGLVGLVAAGSLTANFLPLAPPGTIRAGGILQIFSGAELIEVATGLVIAVFALIGMDDDWAEDSDMDGASGSAARQ